MRFGNILLGVGVLASTMFAEGFINYKSLSKDLKAQAKKDGNFATTQDVKDALKAKDWAVVDVRTIEEWSGGFIEGSQRIGRQAPEKALESIVTDMDDNFVKPNLIVVCNTASRASIDAVKFRDMGFKKVKIYPMVTWIDECNPVVTKYSLSKDKTGSKQKFGSYYAEHCVKPIDKK
ncbi:hypothetical protein GCM10012288_11290 [Malaciobacter pacificus]|jgi:rhodanese-related sulfurtransferase|uniref:Rhodanese-like domain-containing protein n=1 Tax=Malaciobacter pacificus TaxID=1080223 RepID=A0A5C2H3U1_9BACT|nr:rhodanese-like domain-containing protein [Malaciobacter pacificus]QEP33591.1 rhodanese-like domain-containing protein [Malaciobacter pacificus]GGD39032.1 hypothetical protein GCM10012288_11290 [Malaciobacter pacificus]